MTSVRVYHSKLRAKCRIWGVSAKRVLASQKCYMSKVAPSLLNTSRVARDENKMLTLRLKHSHILTFVVTFNCTYTKKTCPLLIQWVEYLTSYYAIRHLTCSSRHCTMRARGPRTVVTGDDSVSVPVGFQCFKSISIILK